MFQRTPSSHHNSDILFWYKRDRYMGVSGRERRTGKAKKYNI